ncbi:MAG: CPBP family intramembrane glutamic endopeptidase [Limnochordia bacterium]
MKPDKPKNHILQYVIYTYGLFGLLLITLGGIATVLLHGTPLVMRWLTAITAWTPTFVFLLMFKRLYPDGTVKDFCRKSFTTKLNIRLLMITALIQILIYISSVYMVSIRRAVPTRSLLDFSLPTVISALFFTLIQGATGEETGWRGYLLPAVVEKHGVVKGSLIVSLIWSFWHTPIWFLGTGYSGTVLIKYITAHVICITSVGFIIGICYYHCKNLFIPIWIHFMLNFFGETYTGSKVDLVTWFAAFYFMMALGVFLWNKSNHDFLKIKRSKWEECPIIRGN